MSKHEKKQNVEEQKVEESLDESIDLNQEEIQVENQENSSQIDEIQILKNDLEAQKNKFLLLAAEYENYRKRTERDKSRIYNDAMSDAIKSMLPVADSLDLAVNANEGSTDDYKKGLELVNNQLLAALNKLGVEKFCESGDPFDPDMHHAVSHVDDESLGENVVANVFQKGYKIGEKVIRHAMVIVAN